MAKAWPRLLVYSAIFTGFGASCVLIGPTAGKLASSLGLSPERLGVLFVYGSCAELAGAVFAGEVYDRAKSAHHVVAASGVFLATFFAMVPLAPSLPLMAAAWTMSCLPRPFLNTGGNLLVVWLLGRRSAPWLNALNGMFGLGATLAPTLATLALHSGDGSRVFSAYFAVSVAVALTSIVTLLLPSPSRQAKGPSFSQGAEGVEAPVEADPEGTILSHQDGGAKEPKAARPAAAFCLAVFFLAMATAFEVALGNWIFTYAEAAGMAHRSASLVNATYWGSFTGARLVILPLLFSRTRLTPAACLVFTAGLMCLAGTSLLGPGPLAIWVCALAGGVGVAPCYGTTVALVRETLPFHGRTQSSLAVACGIGGGIGPWMAARCMRLFGYTSITGFCIATSATCLASSLGMALTTKPESLLRPWSSPTPPSGSSRQGSRTLASGAFASRRNCKRGGFHSVAAEHVAFNSSPLSRRLIFARHGPPWPPPGRVRPPRSPRPGPGLLLAVR